MTNKSKIIIGVVGGVLVLGSIGAAMKGGSGNDTSGTNLESGASDYSSTVDIDSEPDSSQEEVPEPRETAIGKSDKSIDGIITLKTQSVPNDNTGNWKYSGFSESGFEIVEYALSYYNEYFKSDNEIHAVINFADKTTTKINYSNGMLFVSVLKYVDGEEHDANLMFSGDVLGDYIVYTDNGDIEDISEPEDESTPTNEPTSTDPEQSSTTESKPQSTESAENPVQSTVETSVPIENSTTASNKNVVYIAASGNGTKYHKISSCSGMDGNVIEMTREEAEAAGYGACQKKSCYGG